ncbi:MAG TPA: hypothetical protein IGS52_16130 [Oscillatoriaceae cyanobacterium M33_DOE_052]|uniref:PEP-CTERM sorting domain-containing protein n=1 Tax=Planktothricoides sp. SpSt-374 TaxID=2282167 RepID=A0A7C3ZMK2_9CYAN|nr:hypothetical protein [Oscillatoriaceae cyanobacterium M33_DOE_052]
MKSIKTIIGASAATLGFITLNGPAAMAGSLANGTAFTLFLECLNDGVGLVVNNSKVDQFGWQYALDNNKDGTGVNRDDRNYEIYGVGLRETANEIWFTVNANMPLWGNTYSGAADGNVGWGDLFVDLGGTNFASASNAGSLFGVRFAGTNDSGVNQVGVYSGVKSTSVASSNAGYSSLSSHDSHATNWGGAPSLGDLDGTGYYGSNLNQTSIGSGNYEGGISYLSSSDLAGAGYNGGQFGGQQTIGFKFLKSLILGEPVAQTPAEPETPAGDLGTVPGSGSGADAQQVPEPVSMGLLGVIGFGWAKRKFRKQ